MIKNSKVNISLFMTILALSFANYSVASEPSIYQDIIKQSGSLFDAVQSIQSLQAALDPKEGKKFIDQHINNIVELIGQKFNVDPLIPAFYIGTPAAKKYYEDRIQEQRKKLVIRRVDTKFIKYLSDVMEQVLIRYNESVAFEELINDLLKNGAYFRDKGSIKIKEDIWVFGPYKVFEDAKGYDFRRNPDKTPVREILPILNIAVDTLQKEYKGYKQTSPNVSYQRIGKTIVSLYSDNFEGKVYFAVTKLNLDLKQIGDSVLFTIPGQEGRIFSTIGFYPQINSKGYLIAMRSYSGLPAYPKDQLLELFLVDEKGSNIKKIISIPYKDNYSKHFVDVEESYREYDLKPETPLFE